jgi:hypothetical protein
MNLAAIPSVLKYKYHPLCSPDPSNQFLSINQKSTRIVKPAILHRFLFAYLRRKSVLRRRRR